MTTTTVTLEAAKTGSERPVTSTPAAPAPAPTPVSNERPTWLDPKFKTPEQMSDSYKHLEAELTRLRQGTPPDPVAKPTEAKPTADAKATDETPKPDEAAKPDSVVDDLKAAGVDIDGMSSRFWEKGEIVAEDRTVLVDALKEKFGDKADTLIDAFATAQKEAKEYREFRVHEPLGGKEKSAPIIDWAKSNLSQVQKETINSLWAADDVAKQAEGSRMVAMLYAQANGSQPARVLDGEPAPAGDAGYESRQEMSRDMSDPRYKTDPAFQRKVVAKLAKTRSF